MSRLSLVRAFLLSLSLCAPALLADNATPDATPRAENFRIWSLTYASGWCGWNARRSAPTPRSSSSAAGPAQTITSRDPLGRGSLRPAYRAAGDRLKPGEPVTYSEAMKRWIPPHGPPLHITMEY